MRMTLKQLAQYCAVHELDAIIDGDRLCAYCICASLGIVNIVWLK